MSNRPARVAALPDDVAPLTEKVTALYDDFEQALEQLGEPDTADGTPVDAAATSANEAVAEPARADGGVVGWEEIETGRPDGAKHTP